MSAHEATESGMGSPAAVSWTRHEPMPKVTFGIIVLAMAVALQIIFW